MRYDRFTHLGTTWHNAAWYAFCLCAYSRDANATSLEAKMFSYACRDGIVFG